MLLFVTLSCCNALVHAEDTSALFRDIHIYAEENPPFSFHHEGSANGLYVDLVVALLADAGAPQSRENILIAPWSRAYAETLRRDNALLFSVVRSAERERHFKWIGPIGEFKAAFFARKDSQIDIASGFANFIYGATKNAMSETLLLEAGVPPNRIVQVHAADSAAHMLARKRIDIWARDFTVASWTLREQGYQLDDYEVVHAFPGINRYIAANKNTDDRIIQILQAKLDEFRVSGKLAALTKSRPMRPVD